MYFSLLCYYLEATYKHCDPGKKERKNIHAKKYNNPSAFIEFRNLYNVDEDYNRVSSHFYNGFVKYKH